MPSRPTKQILVTQWLFRRAKLRDGTSAGLPFPLFGWPLTSYAGLCGMALVVVMMAFQSTTRIALYMAPFWFGLLAAGYALVRRNGAAPGTPRPTEVPICEGPSNYRVSTWGEKGSS